MCVSLVVMTNPLYEWSFLSQASGREVPMYRGNLLCRITMRKSVDWVPLGTHRNSGQITQVTRVDLVGTTSIKQSRTSFVSKASIFASFSSESFPYLLLYVLKISIV